MITRSQFELDFGSINRQLDEELEAQGISLTNQKFFYLVHERLFEHYVQTGQYEEIMTYMDELFYTAHGDKCFFLIANKLLDNGENQRFIQICRMVISIRRQETYNSEEDLAYGTKRSQEWIAENRHLSFAYNSTINGMKFAMDGAKQLGEQKFYDEISEELQLYIEGKVRKLPKPDPRKMDEDVFWQLVDLARSRSTSVVERSEQLAIILEGFSASAIKQFYSIFLDKLAQLYAYDLWAVAYIALGGCSDDSFEYFRAWVISEGKAVFSAIIKDPESLTMLVDPPQLLESLLYCPHKAYQRRANKPLKLKRRPKAELVGKPWTDEDLPNRFPKACAKFGF